MKKYSYQFGLVSAALLLSSQTALAEYSLSGQVNSAVLFNGDVDDPTIVDNNTSGSRFRFTGSLPINDSIKAGLRYELQAQDNNSSTLTDGTISEVRYSDVYFSGDFGKIGIGKGDGAGNTTFEAYGLINFLGGGLSHLLFQGATGVGYRTKDGISRQNRIRYDSPSFNGLRIAVSLDNNDTNEFALFYKGDVLDGKLDARLGYADRDISRTSYSVAYKHSTGISGSYSFGEDDVDAGDDDVDWIMLGYDVMDNLTVSYGTGEESGGDEMQVLGLNWKPVKGLELYFNSMDFENAGGLDGDAMAIGTRLKFKL